jgi:hypothetical protein
MPSSDKSSWSIWGFYKKSWKLTWNNKKLWILGVAVMVFTSSGSNSSRSENRDEDRKNRYQVEAQVTPPATDSTAITEQELESLFKTAGIQNDALAKRMDPFSQPPLSSLKAGFVQVPLFIKGLAVIEAVGLFIALVVFGTISSTWAMSALMNGVLAASKDKLGTLAEVTRQSFKNIKPLIWVAIVPSVVFILLGGIALVLFGFTLGILVNIVPIIGILLLIVFIILGVYGILRFIAAEVWATLFVVNNKLSGAEAFKQGNALGKHTYWKIVRLGTVNLILALLIYGILFAPALILGVKELSAEVVNQARLLPAVILFVLALPLSALATAIYHVFSFSTFQYAFDSISDMKQEEQS